MGMDECDNCGRKYWQSEIDDTKCSKCYDFNICEKCYNEPYEFICIKCKIKILKKISKEILAIINDNEIDNTDSIESIIKQIIRDI